MIRAGSHLNAEFKSRHEQEYAGVGTPGFGATAEVVAARTLGARAVGEWEVGTGLPGSRRCWPTPSPQPV